MRKNNEDEEEESKDRDAEGFPTQDWMLGEMNKSPDWSVCLSVFVCLSVSVVLHAHTRACV